MQIRTCLRKPKIINGFFCSKLLGFITLFTTQHTNNIFSRFTGVFFSMKYQVVPRSDWQFTEPAKHSEVSKSCKTNIRTNNRIKPKKRAISDNVDYDQQAYTNAQPVAITSTLLRDKEWHRSPYLHRAERSRRNTLVGLGPSQWPT